MTILNSIVSNNANFGLYENFTSGWTGSALILRDTVFTFDQNWDFWSVGNGETFIYHNTFSSFYGDGGGSAAIYSDGTNQMLSAPAFTTPTKQSTY